MAGFRKFFSEVTKGLTNVILEDKKGKSNEFEWKVIDVFTKAVTDNFIYTEADKKADEKKNAEQDKKSQTDNSAQSTDNKQENTPKNTNTANNQGNTKTAQKAVNVPNTEVVANSNDYVSNILKSYFGAYSNQTNSNAKLSAVIVINNYFSGASANDNSVAVIIDNVTNFQNAQNYIDAIINAQTNVQAQQLKEENSKTQPTTEQNSNAAVQNSQIASDTIKDFFSNNASILPPTIIIISFEQNCAEVLSNDKAQKDELIAQVSKIEEIDKLRDNGKTYEIVKGDNLWQIAKDNNISLAELREANPWTEDRFSLDGSYALVYPGEKLVIPGSLEAEVSKELNISSKELKDLSKASAKEAENISKAAKESQAETNQNVNNMTCQKG